MADKSIQGRRATLLALILLPLQPLPVWAEPCSSKIISSLKVAGGGAKPIQLSCDLLLASTDIIQTPIEVSGSKASDTLIDCGGGTLDGTGYKRDTLAIKAVHRPDGSWDPPSNVSIRNCTIKGDLRIIGMAANGQGPWLKQSSLTEGHTARAQAAAPSKVQISNVTFVAAGPIPLYAGPGTTGLVVGNSRFNGRTNGVAIYLDAESAGNIIENNQFDVHTKGREQIAVDGSANNRIAGNTFADPVNGGIFLYRNCGEGGTIRHQAPQGNMIIGNTFRYGGAFGAKPAVWLGSRQGNSRYCFNDPAYPFGSSWNSRDIAQHNSVKENTLPGGSPSLIVNNDAYNQVWGNR
jgi:hypothetical protein